MLPVRRALLSVSDKTGLVEVARALAARNIEILSTGGTASLLKGNGLSVREVSAYTGFPEIMAGRVKTLHPKIHGGLLGRRGTDEQVMALHGIQPIDLLVVNLYPFAETVSRPNCRYAEAIENIDIGGPAMLRAAAKNHESVAVAVDPADYAALLAELAAHDGCTTAATRSRLAAKAFAHTAQYDTMVASYLASRQESAAERFPATLPLVFAKAQDLRYGENPHQQAALYREPIARGRASRRRGCCKARISRSTTSRTRTRRSNACVNSISRPASSSSTPIPAVWPWPARRARLTIARIALIQPRRSAASSRSTASWTRRSPQPSWSASSSRCWRLQPSRRRRCALSPASPMSVCSPLAISPASPPRRGRIPQRQRRTAGADARSGRRGREDLTVVTRRQPAEREVADLLFAWRVCKFVKSNAIVLARDGATIGIGAGQMSRVYSIRLAALKAADEKLTVAGTVMASDAYSPFRDNMDVAAGYGVRAVIQPGGSKRDPEVIAAADEHGMAMVFTGIRHFRH